MSDRCELLPDSLPDSINKDTIADSKESASSISNVDHIGETIEGETASSHSLVTDSTKEDTSKSSEVSHSIITDSSKEDTSKSSEVSHSIITDSSKEDTSKSSEVSNSASSDGVSKFDETKYELIDGSYYYTDESTKIRYKFNNDSQQWVDVTGESATCHNEVTEDSEGRKYYHADGKYLCQDPSGKVFYMNENNEWVDWNSQNNNNKDDNKWYFFKGEESFYRDQTTNFVYKLNKITNSWDKQVGKKRKAKLQDPEVEYDTSESEEEEYETENLEKESSSSGTAPPGFENDPSITFDGQTYLKTDKADGMKYEWDIQQRAWFPKIDDDFMARYQMSYGFNPDGTKNENPVKYDDDELDKEEEEEKLKLALEKKKAEEKEKKKPGWFQADDEHNTKVYVSNLPDDITTQEFVDLMQKCGLVLKDLESGDYKVKLYKNKDGSIKGDALCSYIKVESVELALQILDGYAVGPKNQKISVQRAKFEMKGEYNAALKPKKKQKRQLEKMQRNKEKLFAWTPDPVRGQRGKYDNIVIITNAFSPSEFETHAEKMFTHKERLTGQCSSFGKMRKLELFDRHADGVVKVTYDVPESADLCIASMNDRMYCGRKIAVTVWDGITKYKVEETKEEKEARLKKWDEFLNREEKEAKDKVASS